MQKTLLLFILFLSLSSFSQVINEKFESRVLGETREINIYTPPNYNKKDKKEYPLLLILDGNYLFDPFQGIVSFSSYWEEVPDMIIASVRFKDFQGRDRDYDYDKTTGLPTEFGLKFYEFLEVELLPHLESNYNLATLRMIAGHGKSAGFINFFMYKDNPIFNAYFCFNPVLPEFAIDRVPMFLAKTKRRYFYFLSFCGTDPKDVRKSVPLLDEKIKAANNPLLQYSFNEYKNSTQYSSVISAIPDALSGLYASFQPISIQEFKEKIVKMDGNYADYLIEKYQTIYELLGMRMTIRYNDFKAIEVAILKNGAYSELETLAKLASKEHPKTMLSNYYTGLYHYHTGSLDKCLKEYQRAFPLESIGDLNKEMMMDKMDAVKAEIKG